ncbi:YggT family protein [Gracilibacillus halotolerans]|uniref:YggT family protein n=1 Tax=Gracilibacillus halotolerans TaxID=74386 RepID=A0A841RBT7_9BACI|nr:YggT family protein [Gracilibacillus halotolerans]MBB6511370.1 YggT family protein [Gracilibacillus halotolerans]
MGMLVDLIFTAIRIYSYAIIIYILMSWFPGARESSFGEMLGKIVEPYLEPFRRFIPPIGGMIDISPIVAILVLNFASMGLAQILSMLL